VVQNAAFEDMLFPTRGRGGRLLTIDHSKLSSFQSLLPGGVKRVQRQPTSWNSTSGGLVSSAADSKLAEEREKKSRPGERGAAAQNSAKARGPVARSIREEVGAASSGYGCGADANGAVGMDHAAGVVVERGEAAGGPSSHRSEDRLSHLSCRSA